MPDKITVFISVRQQVDNTEELHSGLSAQIESMQKNRLSACDNMSDQPERTGSTTSLPLSRTACRNVRTASSTVYVTRQYRRTTTHPNVKYGSGKSNSKTPDASVMTSVPMPLWTCIQSSGQPGSTATLTTALSSLFSKQRLHLHVSRIVA